MGSQISQTRTLRAVLCEIERGLFQVAYRTEEGARLARHPLPAYQVGSCASAAKQEIELSARKCGYDTIIWEPAVPSFVFPPALHSARPLY
jgi:hypothetical protein